MRRCVHHASRPKFIWHIDCLCINGCICGFSCKIIWLNVYQTNNDPINHWWLLLDVKANDGCPLKIRTDYGTGNGHESSKAVLLLWIFVLQVFVMLTCASVLGKRWPLGPRLWCLIVSSLLSHWYPGSGVVLDCIDSWSLSSSLLLCTCSSISNISKAHRSWWWHTIHIWYKYK